MKPFNIKEYNDNPSRKVVWKLKIEKVLIHQIKLFQNLFMKEKVYNMENVLREILKNNKYFEEINPDRYVPEFLGLIVNGVVVYHVNWIDIVENEIVFMHKDIQTHPIVSLVLDNLNSLMIITNEGIKEVI